MIDDIPTPSVHDDGKAAAHLRYFLTCLYPWPGPTAWRLYVRRTEDADFNNPVYDQWKAPRP